MWPKQHCTTSLTKGIDLNTTSMGESRCFHISHLTSCHVTMRLNEVDQFPLEPGVRARVLAILADLWDPEQESPKRVSLAQWLRAMARALHMLRSALRAAHSCIDQSHSTDARALVWLLGFFLCCEGRHGRQLLSLPRSDPPPLSPTSQNSVNHPLFPRRTHRQFFIELGGFRGLNLLLFQWDNGAETAIYLSSTKHPSEP